MFVRLKGINKTTKRLADGSVKVYYFLRATGERIEGEPGTPKFVASYNAAAAKTKTAPAGQFRSIIAKYKASAEFTTKAPKTQKDYLRYVSAIEVEFGDMPLAALDDKRVRGDFLEWRDGFAETPRKADYAWSVLARILSFAKNRSLISTNACEKGGRLYEGGDRADIVWSAAALAKLIAVASTDVMDAVILALWTGQRQGDLLRLPWSAYDGRTIRLKQGKTGKRVAIPVGETLRVRLEGIPKRSTIILANSKGTPWTSDGFRSSFWTACEKAGIEDLRFHDLRGTAVTRLAIAGCSVAEIAAITGHSLKDVETILDRHYLGGRVELAEQAVLKLESRFGGQG